MLDRNVLEDKPSLPISQASFWIPIRPGIGSGWVEHAPFAFWLIETIRPRCFVELGSYTGYSFSAVCQAVKSGRIATRCYAVDTWIGDDHAGFYGENIFLDLKSFVDQHYKAFSQLIRSTFNEAVHHFADGSIDLLHIDGRHAYENVKEDFYQWEPKLSPDAIVLFHDTSVYDRDFGVAKFWKEISVGRPHFEFLHGNGLGVLGLSDMALTRLPSLFGPAMDAESAADICAIYARLGSSLTDIQTLLVHRPEALQALQARVTDLERQKDAFSDGCAERDARIIKLEQEKGAYVGGCQERDAIIIEQRAQIADLERRLAELRESHDD